VTCGALDAGSFDDEVHEAARRELERRERATEHVDEWEHAWEHRDKLRAERETSVSAARSIGALHLIDTGCVIYSKSIQRGSEGPIGGVVVQVVSRPVGEEGSGEFARAFRVRWPYVGRWLMTEWTINEDDVDLEACEAPSSSTIRNLLRNLAQDVAKRRGLVTSEERQLVADVHHLMGAV
jgi:hypothetical protein